MANLNLNKVVLAGKLVADPELKQTASGIAVVTLRLAINRRYQSKTADGTQQQQADFINLVAWRQTAEFISRYFHKGSSLCVTGSIQTRTYQDQQGQNRSMTLCEVDKVHFCGSKNSQGFQNAPQGAGTQNVGTYSPVPQNVATGAQSGSTIVAPPFEVITDETTLPF